MGYKDRVDAPSRAPSLFLSVPGLDPAVFHILCDWVVNRMEFHFVELQITNKAKLFKLYELLEELFDAKIQRTMNF